jgi:SAM-dependent methyltransferase
VLDVGCGDKPYGTWLKTATEHVGVDITSGPAVDLVVEPWERWPFPDDSFDGVLCTQVLEHVKDHEHVVAEMIRVLKPGGRLVVSAPFAYCEHGAPDDYQRFSAYGLANLFRGSCDVIEIRRQGGIGSTMAVLFLNWWDCALNLSAAGRIVKGLTLPVWIVASGAVNAAGVLLDWLDHTQAFYGNVLLLARKPCD